MKTITVYGIPNCDVTQKALGWFEEEKIKVIFYDYKISRIQKQKLSGWCKKINWKILLNKRSSTWRALSAAKQAEIQNQDVAINLMMEHASIIKRPIVEYGDQLLIGLNEQEYKRTFSLIF